MKEEFWKGKEIELKIRDMTKEGQGVGKADGFTIFVEGAILGDQVIAKIEDIKKNYALGKIVKVISPSEYRTDSKCIYDMDCDGCQFHRLNYNKQLELKTSIVKNALERIGKIQGAVIHPTIGMKFPYRYRNKGEFKVKSVGGKSSVGYFKRRSHDIINIERCIIQDELSDKIMNSIRDILKNEDTSELKNITVRTTKHKEAMIILTTTRKGFSFKEKLIKRLSNIKEVKSIYQNINPRADSEMMGSRNIKLYGQDTITDCIGGFRYSISPNSFFQVNREQAEVLYEKAVEYLDLKKDEVVVDLYCGIGTISLYLAQKAGKVYGVEAVEEAVKNGQENAVLNRIENVEFIQGLSEDVFPKLLKRGIKADKLVVDPPRRGCEKEVLETIAQMKPKRIVYISCNPATLARDLRYLEERGYKTLEVQPVDLFCWTGHVETVVSLSHKKADTHININVKFGDEKGQIPIDEIGRKAEEGRYNKKAT